MNKEIVQLLDNIADRYVLANDSPRTIAFRSAARNIELLNIEITKKNFQDIDFKGLGKSTIETIKEYVERGFSQRLEELRTKYPPIEALQLLDLYNFDVEYILYLWQTYQAHSIPQLWPLREEENKIYVALQELGRLDTQFHHFKQEDDYYILGDCAVQTSFGQGKIDLQEIAAELVSRDYRHGFVADFFQSPNVLSGVDLKTLQDQQVVLKESQIQNNIRIWQGAVVDVSLKGNPLAPHALYETVDYIILKLSTSPHENVISRLASAVNQVPTNLPIILDCLDKYCLLCIDRTELSKLLLRENVTLGLSGSDYISISRSYDCLQGLPIDRVALMTHGKDQAEYDNINLVRDLAYKLTIPQDKIMNCLPHPFRGDRPLYTSTAGVKSGESSNTSGDQDKLKRLEETLKKIQQLQQSGNHLGSLFKKDEE